MKRIVTLALLLWPASAGAWYYDVGTGLNFGPSGYAAASGFFELGADEGLYLRPSFSSYHSLFVKSTKVYAGRVGWATKHLDLGVEGSFTPKADGYQNDAFAADVTYSVLEGKGSRKPSADGSGRKGLARINFGAGARHITHKEALESLQRRSSSADRPLNTGQTDLSAFAGVSFLVLDLDAQVTQSVYTKNLPLLSRPRQLAAVTGGNPSAFGFPDTCADARLGVRGIPFVKPYAAYTYRQFKSDQPAARTYTAGAVASVGFLQVQASYQLYDPGGGLGKRGYSGASASVKF